jgi:beta-lactamase regulating signal transducer with metallopeptidase domain
MVFESGFILIYVLDILVKGTIILSLALLLDRLSKRANASLRHLLWVLALCAVVALPLTATALPSLSLPILSSDFLVFSPVDVDSAASTAMPETFWSGIMDGKTLLLGLYLVGLCLVLAWQLVGRIYAHRIRFSAKPIADAPFANLLAEVCKELGVSQNVAMLTSRLTPTPFSCGVVKPAVIFPEGVSEWPQPVVKSALVHELSHVKRFDLLWRTIAQVACCLHWVNPVAWIGFRRLVVEQEISCDDLVLQTGTRPSEYARNLLTVAKLTKGQLDFAVAAFGRRIDLKDRLLEILKPKRDKRPLSPGKSLVLLGIAALILAPLSSVDVWFQPNAKAASETGQPKAKLPDAKNPAASVPRESAEVAKMKVKKKSSSPEEMTKKLVEKKVAEMKARGVPEEKIKVFVNDSKKKLAAIQEKESQRKKAEKLNKKPDLSGKGSNQDK